MRDRTSTEATTSTSDQSVPAINHIAAYPSGSIYPDSMCPHEYEKVE